MGAPKKQSTTVRTRTKRSATQVDNVAIRVLSRPVWTVEGEPVLPFMHLVLVKNAYRIKDRLKTLRLPDFPLQGFFWNETEDAWTGKVKTQKQWNLAYEKVVEFAQQESRPVVDERGPWLPTQTRISIQRFFDDVDKVDWLLISGETFQYRDIFKKHGGVFTDAKAWENVGLAALPELVPQFAFMGYDMHGCFNHDGSFTSLLRTSKYKASPAPEGVVMASEDTEYWMVNE
jgi:hypothetical protein